ncbi:MULTISPECIES: DoxX family protein [Haloferax]|uniref:DoxX domain protein n=2 Tax=Haloferax gibbonsii TaxID=35746 RepID=A0A0K1IT44_HALGI|nr:MULTISPECIES: DoxX family protein [Haloferax]AKU07483.1 quinol oxidase [Haloferax gibbonsii]ELZ77089.1 terminal quinol oxidase subunit [Haloferax gibbonsii ATCC 33959]QOS11582.1 DoxX domain protein [Haloferax gibbonsii]RDZ55344.1 DoxX family protein [Haloferax sp. Atlit-4N]REA05002.1 DoxX family protein [Haloferax sp. Atlit-6N]
MSVALQFAAPGADIAFLLARVLFGAVLAFMGLNHFLNLDHMTGYAEMKGLPAARLGVVVSGGMLVFGGLGIALGVLPALAAGAVAVFLVVGTPVFHDFWAVPEDQQESEMTSFLKNVVMLGGALVFLALSGTTWSYAVGLTLF